MNDQKTGDLSPRWPRRQWRKLVALIEDHPIPMVSLLAVAIAFVVFYAFHLDGLGHFQESFSRWQVENFGGVHHVERSARNPDVVLSFAETPYDRLDVLSLLSPHFGGTAYNEELKKLTARGGRIRILTLDPRLGDSSHPRHEAFAKLAEANGQEVWEFRARIWYSIAVLLHLKQDLGEALDLRVLAVPMPEARPPFFVLGRSSQAYCSDRPEVRMDILVPRPERPTYSDSFTHPAIIVRDQPDQPEVKRFSQAFERAWASAIRVDEALAQTFLQHLDGEISR